MRRFKRFGPFSYFKIKETKGLSAWFTNCDEIGFGFEWGYKDQMRGSDRALIEFRVGKLMIVYFEKFKEGFEIWILGFWCIL